MMICHLLEVEFFSWLAPVQFHSWILVWTVDHTSTGQLKNTNGQSLCTIVTVCSAKLLTPTVGQSDCSPGSHRCEGYLHLLFVDGLCLLGAMQGFLARDFSNKAKLTRRQFIVIV